MRLADYIVANTQTIIQEWENFATTALPGATNMEQLALRNRISDILIALVADMTRAQSAQAQSDKTWDLGDDSAGATGAVAAVHAAARHADRFPLVQVLGEFRTLRGTVMRLWRQGESSVDHRDMLDVIHFDEALDQSIAQCVQRYANRANESKDLLLGVIGHELRDPLATVAMSAELLARHVSSEPVYAATVGRQKRAIERMGYIISDLFDVTAVRLGSGMAIVPTSCDLAAVCSDCIHEIQATHPGSDIALESAGDCRGEWDESRLRQVVINLLGNALKHGNGGRVQVSTRGDTEKVTLAITNHGAIISEDDQVRIFGPLMRGIGKRPDPSGLGLGLYISQAIVESHRGPLPADRR